MSTVVDTKTCTKCGEEKYLEEFNKTKKTKDGRQDKCRQCCKAYYNANKARLLEQKKSYYEANHQESLGKAKKYRESNGEKINAYLKAYRRDHPEKVKAGAKKYRKTNAKKVADANKKWRHLNKESLQEKRRVYVEAHKEVIKEKKKDYYEANKQTILANQKLRDDSMRDEIRAKQRAARKANYDSVRAREKAYKDENRNTINQRYRKRYRSDPAFRLRLIARAFVAKALKGNAKDKQTIQYLGCTYEHLRNHIESLFSPEMSWENHATYWELDHIYPMAAMNEKDKVHLLAINNWQNLQPLEYEKNREKRDKVTPAAKRLFKKLVKQFKTL